MGLSVTPRWARGSCGSTAAAPGLHKQARRKKETASYAVGAPCATGHRAGKQCPEGSSSRWQRTEVRAKGREEEAEQTRVCVSVCTALLSPSTSASMQRCGYVCRARAGRVSTVLGAGGHVWRPAVTVNALQPSPAASQATSREFRHFPFSSGGHCLAVINRLYFPVAILEGRRGGTIKLLGRSFSVNALSPSHCLVFYLGLHYECLSSQSSWS